MRISVKGQVTIPAAIREKAGLLPDTEVGFAVAGKRVYIFKAAGSRHRGKALVEAMRGKGTVQMTTDQIMALTRGR